MNLTPVFDQYLRHTALPTLELTFDERGGHRLLSLEGRRAGVRMPVRVGTKDHWQIIRPTHQPGRP